MFHYFIKRLLLAFFTLFVIMVISYALLRLSPGDPTKSSFLGENSAMTEGLSAGKSDLAKNNSMRERLHLDEPVYVGFALWMKGVLLHGDFGVSVAVDKGRSVVSLIMERLPVTLTINFWAILITYLLAIPIGIYSAISTRSKTDSVITVILFLLYSLPVFWVALLLQVVFCDGGYIPIFPLKGISAGSVQGLSTWSILLRTGLHYVLPVICLSYAGIAGLSRFARTSMLEVIRKDYIRTARAKGLPEHIVILKHALRNAVIILITLFAGLIPGLIAGSIIIEYVFSIPGMGDLSMLALSSRDLPLLMALFCFAGVLTLIGIFVADIMYVLVDPRITFDKKR